MYRIFID